MKSLFIIFAALFLIIAIPWVFDAVDDALTEEYTETFAGVTTAAGVYAANVTLAEALWQDSSTSVSDISSNLSGYDTPSVSNYNTVSHALQVNGLEQSQVRTLSVDFEMESTTLPDAFATFLVLFRWWYLFIVLGTSGGAIYAFFVT